MAEAGELDQRGRSEETLLSPTNLTKAPHASVRTTIRTIIIIVATLIVAMWAVVGFSLINSRQHALDDARLQGRNLMIAFREEIAFILRGVEGEMTMIEGRMRRERERFDLYAWSRQEVLVAPGVAHATIINTDGKLSQTTIDRQPPPRLTLATARIFGSIWTENFAACMSAHRP